MQNSGLHWIKVSIAVSRINNGMEFCMKRNAMAAHRKLEIRCVRNSLHFDPPESAGVLTFRRQDSRDTLQSSEIGGREEIASLYCRVARTGLGDGADQSR